MAPGTARVRFRLKSPTIAVAHSRGNEDIFHLPADAEITVLNPLDGSDVPNRMVEIEWLNRRLRMFAVDIQERGERCGMLYR